MSVQRQQGRSSKHSGSNGEMEGRRQKTERSIEEEKKSQGENEIDAPPGSSRLANQSEHRCILGFKSPIVIKYFVPEITLQFVGLDLRRVLACVFWFHAIIRPRSGNIKKRQILFIYTPKQGFLLCSTRL